MLDYRPYREANRALWNELARLHPNTAVYDLAGFQAGGLTLKAIERAELGAVSGKSLLHLQCHFGLDTLSWARLGARVTGVDFSDQAIDLARQLSDEVKVPATFICADIYDLSEQLAREFDVVFTSYGVLCWLPDLVRWGRVIARFLRAGGTFYIVEEHPVTNVFDNSAEARPLRVGYPYFQKGPIECPTQGSYADRTARLNSPVSYQWVHTLGDVINALLAAGLQLEFLHEFPVCNYMKLPLMRLGEDGWWRVDHEPEIPLLFSVKARKSKTRKRSR